MKNLEKAKERAESYLYRIIEQKWDKPGIPVLIKEREKPPRTIRIKMKKRRDYFDLMNWPLRFEAYSYLGNKYKKKIRSFARELRELWDEWIELSKKGLFGSERIFWPDNLHFIGIYEEGEASFPVFEIERHISMFRAKEILGIAGFDPYFNEAKKRIIEMLYSNPFFLSENDARIIWQVVRSPFIKSEISEHLKVTALRIIDDTPLESGYSPIYQSPTFHKASSLFFLCFGFSGNEFLDLAKKDISQLINKQEKNGSFGFDVLTTCLAASSIHFTKLDWSESVCDKAVEYILEKQNKEGYWDFLFGESISHGDRTDWNVLSTVVVLETLDFIKNDKPLPLWALEAEPEDISRLHKHPRIQIDKPLSVPGRINWSDVSIWFISPEKVEVRAGIPLGVLNFIEMGFKDERIKKPDSYKPDLSWAALMSFAKLNQEISWKDKGVEEEVRNSLKSCVKVIRIRLKFLFGIQSDPFHPYDRGNRSYRTRFKISFREANQD